MPTTYQIEALKRLKEGDETATNAVMYLAYDLILTAMPISLVDHEANGVTLIRIQSAMLHLIEEMQWHLDMGDDGKELAERCEDLAFVLQIYDNERKERR